MEHANVQETQSNRRKFDVEERVVDIFGGFGSQKANAAGSRHGKSCRGNGYGWCGNGGGGGSLPKNQQPKSDYQEPAGERSDTPKVGEINEALNPHAPPPPGGAQQGNPKAR